MNPSSQTVCGPFDQQFNRKFRGVFARSMSAERIKLAKTPKEPSFKGRGIAQNPVEMLPKLKQIEKIARTQRKKPQKINKYVDGVSDLELYIANKMMKSLSTREIVSQISGKSHPDNENRKVVIENYLRMSSTGSNHEKFHAISRENSEQERLSLQMSRTSGVQFGRKPPKMKSDQQFIEKFDEFIVKKKDEDEPGSKEKNSMKEIITPQEAERQISIDKQRLTRIARKMIADHNNFTEEDEMAADDNVYVYHDDPDAPSPKRSIDWIIKECISYEKKFSIKKGKSRNKG